MKTKSQIILRKKKLLHRSVTFVLTTNKDIDKIRGCYQTLFTNTHLPILSICKRESNKN